MNQFPYKASEILKPYLPTSGRASETPIDWDRVAALVDTQKRSAWDRGVGAYAVDFVDFLRDGVEHGWIDEDDLCNAHLIEKALLNGAEDWSQYSWGGCAFCYDGQIAEMLCTPSELKKTHNGQKKPNPSEDWLDVQARACYQAALRIIRAIILDRA